MIQYLFANRDLIPSAKETGSASPLISATECTLSLVPIKVRRKAITARIPSTAKVFVQAAALSPKNSTRGSVTILIVKVPAVARRFLKILSTDLS